MWIVPLAFLAMGFLFVLVSLYALREYRTLFFSDPRTTMSVEVILQILFHPAAGPGYLASLALMVGSWFLIIGVMGILFLLSLLLGNLVNLWS